MLVSYFSSIPDMSLASLLSRPPLRLQFDRTIHAWQGQLVLSSICHVVDVFISLMTTGECISLNRELGRVDMAGECQVPTLLREEGTKEGRETFPLMAIANAAECD